MKRSSIRKIGKRGKINIAANKKLDKLYSGKGITECELGLEGCLGGMYCHIAHRHKRWWYYQRQELLSSFNQTIVACDGCHSKIESNPELTEEMFMKLRGKEVKTAKGK